MERLVQFVTAELEGLFGAVFKANLVSEQVVLQFTEKSVYSRNRSFTGPLCSKHLFLSKLNPLSWLAIESRFELWCLKHFRILKTFEK